MDFGGQLGSNRLIKATCLRVSTCTGLPGWAMQLCPPSVMGPRLPLAPLRGMGWVQGAGPGRREGLGVSGGDSSARVASAAVVRSLS